MRKSKQKIRDVRAIPQTAAKTTTIYPTAKTLSSFPVCGPKEYSFCLPKNNLLKTTTREISIDGNLGDRKFVVVDGTKFLLRHQETTEAVVFYDRKKNTVRICSTTFPGRHGRKQPTTTKNDDILFEWGVVRAKNVFLGGRGYTLTTPHDGKYTMKRPREPTKGRRYNPVTEIRSSRKGNHKSNIYATLAETHSSWKCRTITGSIDPAMLACFVFAIDIFHHRHNKEYESLVYLINESIMAARTSEQV